MPSNRPVRALVFFLAFFLTFLTASIGTAIAQTGESVGSIQRKVLFEEFTGEWCSLCPAGSIEMGRAIHAFAGSVVPVSYHDNDPLELPELNTMLASIPFDPLYPGGTFDRIPFAINNPKHKMSVDRSDFRATLAAALARPAFVSISAAVTLDPGTRVLTVIPRVQFQQADTGDFRIQCVVTENAVRRDNLQRNAYDKDSVSYPTLFGAGDPLREWSNDHLARALLGGPVGRASVIPAIPRIGNAYQTTFTFTVPTQVNIDRIGVVVFVARFLTGSLTGNEVLNAEGYLSSAITNLSAPVKAGTFDLRVYPNPSDGIVYLQLPAAVESRFEVEVFDLMGRRVQAAQHRASGEIVQLDLGSEGAGIYILRCVSGQTVKTGLVLRR